MFLVSHLEHTLFAGNKVASWLHILYIIWARTLRTFECEELEEESTLWTCGLFSNFSSPYTSGRTTYYDSLHCEGNVTSAPCQTSSRCGQWLRRKEARNGSSIIELRQPNPNDCGVYNQFTRGHWGKNLREFFFCIFHLQGDIDYL